MRFRNEKVIYVFFAFVLFFIWPGCPNSRSQSAETRKGYWSYWLPAQNSVYRDEYGFEHPTSDFSYRWRNSTPCRNKDKDCSFDLQLRNNRDRSEYMNYVVFIEQEDGHMITDRDHRNFGPDEIQDLSVDGYGQRITGVKIEKY